MINVVELDDSQVGVEIEGNDAGGIFTPIEELN